MSNDYNDIHLEMNPANELKFRGPFNNVVTSHMILKNIGSKAVCYKVKTTAPKMYCVRPNTGLIEPGSFIDISVMLQPFDYNSSEKMKHKFLIQSVVVDNNIPENIEQLWKNVDKELVKEAKLRCCFEIPETAGGDTKQASEDTINVSNNAQPGLATTVEDLKKQLEDLKSENDKLKQTETRLRNIALQDTLENSVIPNVVDQQSKQSFTNSFMLLVVLCIMSFIVGLLIAKFTI